MYKRQHATAPVFVQSLLLSNQPQGPTYIKIDPTGNFLYALGSANPSDQGAALLHVLNINQTDGTLTETVNPATLNVAQGEHPQGLSVLME